MGFFSKLVASCNYVSFSKGEREREKERRHSRVYHVTSALMSTFLTARVAQVLIPAGSKKLMLRTSRTNRTLCTSESGERKAFMVWP